MKKRIKLKKLLAGLSDVEQEAIFFRILQRVEFQESGLSQPCWVFQGWDDGKGYKKIEIRGRATYVHRLAFFLITGNDVPGARQLDHVCRRRACCNPEHTRVVTQKKHNRITHLGKRRPRFGWRRGLLIRKFTKACLKAAGALQLVGTVGFRQENAAPQQPAYGTFHPSLY